MYINLATGVPECVVNREDTAFIYNVWQYLIKLLIRQRTIILSAIPLATGTVILIISLK